MGKRVFFILFSIFFCIVELLDSIKREPNDIYFSSAQIANKLFSVNLKITTNSR